MISHSPDASFPCDDDRFFSAVRYLLAEMSAQEAARFEAELDESQELRELLAEAVLVLEMASAVGPVDALAEAQLAEAQLTALQSTAVQSTAVQSTAAPASPVDLKCSPGSTSNEPSFRWSSRIWVALAASLLLAGGIGLGVNFWPGQGLIADRSEHTSADETQLAAAWARRAAVQEDELTTLWDEGLLTAATADEPGPEDTFDRLLVASPDPPAWMLQALSAQQEDESTQPAL